MSALKWMFIVACSMALTACPDNNPILREKETAKYSGVWVRSQDYCEYMAGGYGPTDYRCDDVQWEDNRSVMANDDAWLIISINRDGGINSFSLYSSDESNGNLGLGYVNNEGYYVGYLTTMGNKRKWDVIRVFVDGQFLSMVKEGRAISNRVGFMRLTEREARDFETAYNDCTGEAYCKGKNSTAKEQRQAKRDKNNGKFDQEKYDLCVADDNATPEECEQQN